jgi:hypothetical protein
MRKLVHVLSLAILVAGSVSAQYVVSAHSGLINKAEGQVFLDGKLVEPKVAEFPEVKIDQTLSTEDGRAEVLLTPGSYIRLDENSSFQMIQNKLANTRVKVLTGSALLEVSEILSENSITLLFGETEVVIVKPGVYRIDAAQSRLRVYDGEARVISGAQTVTAKRGKEVTLGALLVAGNFDTKATDSFHRWSARRAEYIAKANVSAANTSRGNCATSGSNCGSTWSYNPWFGLYTWIPGRGTVCSFYGYCYYSPSSVYYLYYPPQNYDYNRNAGMPTFSNPSSPSFDSSVGYNTSARSGVSTSMPSTSPVSSGASAAAAGSSRGGGAATSSAGGARGH